MAKRAMPTQVKIEGMEELQKKLRRLPENIKKRVLSKAIRKGAKVIAVAAAAKAPRRTSLPTRASGTPLNKAIKVRGARRRSGHDESSVSIGGGKEAPHAHLVELGTVHSAAQPFLRPAFDQNKDEAIRIIRRELEDAITRDAQA